MATGLNQANRILVSRTDRLGDVLMTLPALEYLRHQLSDYRIDFLCPPGYHGLLGPYLSSRGITPLGRLSEPVTGYAGALLLFASARTLWSCARAGIAVRVGPYSKVASFLFLNRGVRQRRSEATMNEAEYNLSLARKLVTELTGEVSPKGAAHIELPANSVAAAEGARVLASAGVLPADGFLLLHPGMGGSALNLSAGKYVELVDAAEKKYGLRCLLSEGPCAEDRRLVGEILNFRPRLSVVRGLSLAGLAEVFRRARLVLAPSTGPLHLAHYVGTATLGLYSPLKSQHPHRWEPWGGSGRSRVVVPEVDCPGRGGCLGERCPAYSCLDSLELSDLILPPESDLNRPESRG